MINIWLLCGYYMVNGWLIDDNWLVVDLPLWEMMEFVSWDDDIPNITNVANHQSVMDG